MELFKELSSGVSTATTDLAEATGFIGEIESVPSFDVRTDAILLETVMDSPNPIVRERALWELAYRQGNQSINLLTDVYNAEPIPCIRQNLLWLSLKLTELSALPLLEIALEDENREVRDWAKLYMNEATGTELAPEYTKAYFTEEGIYDQTLPLQIAGFAIIDVPNIGAVRATLSPLWFEKIMGRVLACTNRDTFMTNLTIEKCIYDYEGTGKHHFETYPFRGISWKSKDGRTQHRYESISDRKFYLSGKVLDESMGVITTPVIINRGASTVDDGLAFVSTERPTFSTDIFRTPLEVPRSQPERINTTATTGERGLRLLNGRVVRGVRGQFFGWAATSLEHYKNAGDVEPGTVQLANPLNSETSAFVNTYLCGTFRGKLGDYDGDGEAELNLIECHEDDGVQA